MGLLVESLWDRGVEAWGIDISPYAIGKVRPDMKPYCRVGSLTDPIDGSYALVTCIEVLEHLPAEQARIAAENLTRITDAILFSSSPTDFVEPTHFNVQPNYGWIRIFASLNYAPDITFDASFITPHAILFRKEHQHSNEDVTRLFSEHLRFKTNLHEFHQRIDSLQSQIAGKDGELDRVTADAAERGQVIQRLQEELSQRKSESQWQQEALTQSKAEAQRLQQELSRQEAERQPLQEALSRESVEARRLEEELSQSQVEARRLREELSQRRAESQWQQEALTQSKAEAQRLQQELSQEKAESKWLQEELSQQTVKGKRWQEELSQNRAKAQWLQEELARNKAAYRLVVTSTSWRITSPFRSGRRKLSKFKRLPRRLELVKRLKRYRDKRFVAATGQFDSDWYLERYPDVRAAEVNPIAHYLRFGAAEGRDPSPHFDSDRYLDQYPDVRAAGVNPFVHYLRFGAAEGRLGKARPDSIYPSAAKRPPRAEVRPAPEPPSSARVRSGAEARPVAELRHIAWVTNDSDRQTMVYRVHNYAGIFRERGMEVTIAPATKLTYDQVAAADILILCRIAGDANTFSVIEAFKKSGRPVIYDIDDLVFRPEFIGYVRAVATWGDKLRNEFSAFVQRNLETILRCDLVTASTVALKEDLGRLGKQARVIPNTIAPEHARLAPQWIRRRKAVRRERLRIGYFSGTKTHERDFAECSAAVLQLMRERSDVELAIVGELDLPDEFHQVEDRVIRYPLMPFDEMLEILSGIDINLAPLELNNPFTNGKSELKVFEAALFAIPSIASPTSGYAGVIQHGRNGLLAATQEEWLEALRLLVTDAAAPDRLGEEAQRTIATRFMVSTTVEEATALYRAAVEGCYCPRAVPAADPGQSLSVTVVAVLYNKAREVPFFLESMRRQSFRGRYELVLVDDCSRDDSIETTEQFIASRAPLPDSNPGMSVRVLRNSENSGNCASRNRAIRESTGDVIVVVDADCMLNSDFLRAHAEAYEKGDCDAAIGPLNIETGDRPPLAVLNCHEGDWRLGGQEALPQDSTNLDSFVNCITRNFSVRRAFVEQCLKEELFDLQFSYSAKPDTGFGWEDVEMGYRLHKQGARLKYLPTTVSIHVSHPPSSDIADRPLRSLRNFRRLHEKHPDLYLEARQWSIRTYQAIVDWARSIATDLSTNADYLCLEPIFERYRRAPIVIDRYRALRVLTYRWHCSHQYELYRSGHAFTLARGAGTALCESWDWGTRPLPVNARFRSSDEIDPRNFDVAILHFDENVLRPNLTRGRLTEDWGRTFLHALKDWDLPKIAICHGTPQFYGQFDPEYKGADLGQVIEESRQDLVRLLQDVLVVCNSNQAEHEWGFSRSRTIWHGFAPHEYPPGVHDRGVLSMPRGALTNRPHYNGLAIHDQTRELLGEAVPFHHLSVPDPLPAYRPGTANWAIAKYQNYVREVGRYAIYFNPTQRSPMPRSRGEAMMAGLATVSLRTHDAEMFIRNGVNGFYADSPEELAEQILFLSRNDKARQNIARASRRTAVDLFNQDRYLAEWSVMLKQVAN
jgi:glycosyltransferase involved in cell wall biosynthesis